MKNFSKYVGAGLFLDLASTLCLMFLQALNNSTIIDNLGALSNTGLQTLALITKLIIIFDIAIETLMYLFEVYQLK